MSSGEEDISIDPLEEFDPIDEFRRDLSSQNDHCRRYESILAGVKLTRADKERAATVTPIDFRYRCDMLFDHQELITYVTDFLPSWASQRERRLPISKNLSSRYISALDEILHEELLNKHSERSFPDTVEEYRFHLLAWHLCEEEPGRGHPKGSRYIDGTFNAASYAWTLQEDAKKEGIAISRVEAARRAVEEFEVISAKDFDAHPDKGSVIVSDALGADGPFGGAVRKVSDELREISERDS